jgi:CBS domain-containing protein
MRCPSCGFDNLPGMDACEHCQVSLTQEDHAQVRIRTWIDRRLREDTVAELQPVPPLTVGERSPLAGAIEAMREHSVGCVLVIDEDGRLTGILSERDLLIKIGVEPVDLEQRTVAEFMTRDPETVRRRHPLAFAVQRMVVGDHRHLPLVDAAGRPTGIVSSRDIVDYIAVHFREAGSS